MVPPAVVTLTLPDAPVATCAEIVVDETTKKDVAAIPPKLTAVVPVKFVPVMVTTVPVPPTNGAKVVTEGGGMI